MTPTEEGLAVQEQSNRKEDYAIMRLGKVIKHVAVITVLAVLYIIASYFTAKYNYRYPFFYIPFAVCVMYMLVIMDKMVTKKYYELSIKGAEVESE